MNLLGDGLVAAAALMNRGGFGGGATRGVRLGLGSSRLGNGRLERRGTSANLATKENIEAVRQIFQGLDLGSGSGFESERSIKQGKSVGFHQAYVPRYYQRSWERRREREIYLSQRKRQQVTMASLLSFSSFFNVRNLCF